MSAIFCFLFGDEHPMLEQNYGEKLVFNYCLNPPFLLQML